MRWVCSESIVVIRACRRIKRANMCNFINFSTFGFGPDLDRVNMATAFA